MYYELLLLFIYAYTHKIGYIYRIYPISFFLFTQYSSLFLALLLFYFFFQNQARAYAIIVTFLFLSLRL